MAISTIARRFSELTAAAAFFSLGITSVHAADPATIAAYLEQFKHSVSARAETLAAIGGDDGATGGVYTFVNNNTDLNINKLSGRGTIGEPLKLLNTGLTWQPLFGGSIGYLTAENRFKSSPALVGNIEEYSSFSMGFETGMQINLTEELSIGPMIGLIYAHANSKFTPGNTLGADLKLNYAKQLVDWNMDSLTTVPSIYLQYEKIFAKDWRLTLSTRYEWFNTWDVGSSSRLLSVSGNTSCWETKADLDIRLPIKVFDFPLHTGGFFTVDMYGGNFRDSIGTNAMYTINGRLVVGDLTGLWKVNWLGIGVSYIKANTFHGFSWGLDARLLF